MLAYPAAAALMEEWTASPSLRSHMRAVAAAMRAYARRLAPADEERWATAGILHDFDYERFPNDAQAADAEHPAEGVRHLRTLGVDDEICDAILGHAHYTGVARLTPMAKALFAVDELTGLITACALVKPGKSLAEVEVAGVKKKMKDKAFARGVNRDDIREGAESLGVALEEHIAVVLEAMRAIDGELGLDGRLAAGGSAPPPTPSGAASTPPSGDA